MGFMSLEHLNAALEKPHTHRPAPEKNNTDEEP